MAPEALIFILSIALLILAGGDYKAARDAIREAKELMKTAKELICEAKEAVEEK